MSTVSDISDMETEVSIHAVAAPKKNDMLALFYQKILTRWQKVLMHWERIAFWLIFAFGAALRLYQFPGTPAGIWIDEVTEGYDAFAILQHGTDRWGNPFPIYFPNWGSGQNVLQAYLSIPFIKLFGLNVLSVRLVPLILGILAIPLLYLTVKKIYGTKTALLAAFLLATIPWSVMATRWGLESNILPFFLLLSTCALIYAYDSPHRRRWIPLSLIPMALSFYAYGVSFIPITGFLALFLLLNRKVIWQEKISFVLSMFIFLLIATPFLLFIVENDVVHRQLGFLAHWPITIPYLPLNRLDEVQFGLSRTTLIMTNIRFLISGFNDPWISNNVPWISPLGWLVPPFAAIGAYFSLKRCQPSRNLFLYWLFTVLPLFALFELTVHRTNALFIPLIVMGAYGMICLTEYVQPINVQTVVTCVLIGSLFFPNLVFYKYYFTQFDQDNASFFYPGYDQALAHALASAHKDESIYVDISNDWANYTDTLFYLHIDAQDFHKRANIQVINGMYWVRNYDRFYFGYFAPPPALTNAPSYIAILRTGFFSVPCQHVDILYQDNTWFNSHWTVERCYPAHNK